MNMALSYVFQCGSIASGRSTMARFQIIYVDLKLACDAMKFGEGAFSVSHGAEVQVVVINVSSALKLAYALNQFSVDCRCDHLGEKK